MTQTPTTPPATDDPTAEAPPAIEKGIFQPRTLLGFLLAGVALFFVYRSGLKLDFREVWARCVRQHADPAWWRSSSTIAPYLPRETLGDTAQQRWL